MAITDGPMVGKEQKVTWKGSGSHVFVDGVDSISFSARAGTAETTCALTTQDLADKTFLGTLREWTATLRLKYVNFGDTNGQLDMYNRLGAKTPIETILYMDLATKVTGDTIVTGFDTDEPIDGVAGGTITLQGSGILTPAAA